MVSIRAWVSVLWPGVWVRSLECLEVLRGSEWLALAERPDSCFLSSAAWSSEYIAHLLMPGRRPVGRRRREHASRRIQLQLLPLGMLSFSSFRHARHAAPFAKNYTSAELV